MPIANIRDAHEIERGLQNILTAHDADGRAREIRKLFVETLDFDHADVLATLGAAKDPNLPPDARLLARRGGFSVLYIPLEQADDNRVKTTTASAAAKVIGDQIAEEPLLLFTNRDCDELHIIYPDLSGSRPRLQRMVAHRGQPGRTVVEQIANLWHDYGVSGKTMGEAVRNAFSVQPVTDAFFRDYKAAYDDAVSLIAANIERVYAEQFTQTLFNRLLFVHFVSRKGWLKFNGDTDYLNALWQDYEASPSSTNFYRDRLRTLFFDGLNNPQSPDPTSRVQPLIGEVPFLNGGLFEETDLDRRAVDAVPDDAIVPLLTDLFNHYNFTVMEATPLDTEVAVDPEMLGKLFEETVNERHSNGAYYTPRPVVSFMCREAIKGYLSGKNIGGLTDAKIADLVDQRNPDAIAQPQALEIAKALAVMRAVDPACGSGAFLLGMLQEILALNDSLFRAGHTAESLYQQKLVIITNNIYGADKDDLAVSTAMLRLWLSLAVDYDGNGPADPLPNLDMKLVAGDAIAGPDPDNTALNQDWFRVYAEQSSLQQDIAAYTTAYGDEKAKLKQQVDDTKAQLRSSLKGTAPADVVEWRIDFADVMQSGGFDVVIANPPYVRQEEITPKTYKDAIIKQYGNTVNGKSDLYCYFYTRGLQLLRDGGMHVFVCSNSWLDVGYGAKLQEHLLKTVHVWAVYESAVQRQFATADINTIISVIRKAGSVTNGDLTRFVSLRAEFDDALADPAKRREITQTRAALRTAGTIGRKFVGDKWGGKYLRAPDIYHAILNKCADKLARLGDVATVRRGVTTGANDFFFLRAESITEFGIEEEYFLPVMTKPQESRTIAVGPATLPKRLFLCHEDKAQLAGTGALAYIEWGESECYHERSTVQSRRLWYDLGERSTSQLAMNYLIGTTARTFFFENGVHFGDNFQEIRTSAASQLQLCTVLNSTVSQLMLNISGRANFGGGLMKVQTFEIASLQVANPGLLEVPNESIFRRPNWDVLTPSSERRQIDDAVFDALQLTQGEQEAVYEGVNELVGNRIAKAKT